ncbi:unnamed protein product [Effrenium voratum]|uniref:RanBP2-type domain-containing protein n=1 Tax=Effrenium voratum TaxID=2562239 RepID=A0AA36HWJ3_9DINO|nr:unnamed protein product [Effrenium voratum]CAJ1375498.1 unnamed protein product [Effrenium voratum]CAJ1445020.1 unnamed protein product [Effrenium voratum]|mmetsp:Transcript_46754/g.111148  ORF Transcript_46754/g.111148 Transcript_46754/m.111148 type:complete len:170 (+) Transcript_46754:47-556(+)
MTNRPPAPGTYDPRDWKCPNCKTLNFKKRKNCLSCANERPPQTREQAMPDWRTGKKDCGNNVNADWTCRPCGRFNLAVDRFCLSCKKENPNWVDVATLTVEGRSGRLGGHFDRPDPDEPKKEWNSDDEEYDEFGRKKRRGVKSSSDKQKAALERLRRKAGGAPSRSRSR